uniref:Putative secreted protein n=1 Tax=Ixodes ricinus TaxID=34613 RepID=A0A6B0USX8_IXORI
MPTLGLFFAGNSRMLSCQRRILYRVFLVCLLSSPCFSSACMNMPQMLSHLASFFSIEGQLRSVQTKTKMTDNYFVRGSLPNKEQTCLMNTCKVHMLPPDYRPTHCLQTNPHLLTPGVGTARQQRHRRGMTPEPRVGV